MGKPFIVLHFDGPPFKKVYPRTIVGLQSTGKHFSPVTLSGRVWGLDLSN